MKIMSKPLAGLMLILIASLTFLPAASAEQSQQKMLVTLLTASNQGADFNLDNDEYRDRLIQLFSYSSYDQINQWRIMLAKAERQTIPLVEDYELVLTLQAEEADRFQVEAMIRKGNVSYVNTILTILKNGGVVFLGGPKVENGNLIVVLEKP